MAKRGRKSAGGAGRGKGLSRDLVLETGVTQADEEGLSGLSMRKLAQSLGVEAMSLYNHVASKDDLLDGMVDRVVGEIQVPSLDDPWSDALRMRAKSAREVLLRHPWVTQQIVSRVNIGPNMLRYIESTLGCLRQAGFTPAQSDQAWNAMDSYVYGYTLQELNFPFEPDQYAAAAREYLPTLPRVE